MRLSGMHAAAALVLVAAACGTKGSGEAPPAPKSADSPPLSPPVLSENEEMTLLIRALWPVARDADSADWKWAKCHDETKGYETARECLGHALASASRAQKKLPETRPKTECGKSVADAHKTFVDNRVEHMTAYATWMDKNEVALRRLMVAKALTDVSDRVKGVPASPDQNKCVVALLKCGSLGCSSMFLNKMAGVSDR